MTQQQQSEPPLTPYEIVLDAIAEERIAADLYNYFKGEHQTRQRYTATRAETDRLIREYVEDR